MAELIDAEGVYLFEGLPITPSVMRDIVKNIYAPSEPFTRAEATRRVVDFHQSHGGGISSVNPISQMKKALQTMAGAGEVERMPGYGYWQRLALHDEHDTLAKLDEESALETVEDDELFPTLNESGNGDGAIYAYYFPSYHSAEEPFPIKIGMSTSAYQGRVASQLGTSNPERPIVYRVHYTDSPSTLERYLHSALTLEGAWMDDAPGTEWFCIRPERIDELLEFVGLIDGEDKD